MAIIYRSLRLIVIMTFALGGGAIDASGQALITYDLVGVTFGSNITVSGSFTLDYACAQTRNICISNVNLTVTGIVGDPVTDQSDITYDPSPAGGGGTNVCDQFLSFCSYTSFAFHAKDGNDQLSLSAPLNTDLRNTIILSSVAPAASAGSYDHNLKQFGPLTGGKLVPRGVCEV